MKNEEEKKIKEIQKDLIEIKELINAYIQNRKLQNKQLIKILNTYKKHSDIHT